MNRSFSIPAIILGVCLLSGLAVLGSLLGKAALEIKSMERSVTVKGLSEREYNANIVIWPLMYTIASNDLKGLYTSIDEQTKLIHEHLTSNGVAQEEISSSTPTITDKSAQQYGNTSDSEFRYVASRTVTVYSKNVTGVRQTMNTLSELGKKGIVFAGDSYQPQTEYIFTNLNNIKPEMIEEATRKAREVAEKFAADSKSSLGKIKKASQGRFTIQARDKNNPDIKKIRVVSTVEYYLSD